MPRKKWCEHYVVVNGKQLGPYHTTRETIAVARHFATQRKNAKYDGPTSEWCCTSVHPGSMMTRYLGNRKVRSYDVRIIWDRRVDRIDKN